MKNRVGTRVCIKIVVSFLLIMHPSSWYFMSRYSEYGILFSKVAFFLFWTLYWHILMFRFVILKEYMLGGWQLCLNINACKTKGTFVSL